MTASELIAASRREERLSGFLLEYERQIVAGIAVEDLSKESRVASFAIVEVDPPSPSRILETSRTTVDESLLQRLLLEARDEANSLARSRCCSSRAVRLQDCAREFGIDGELSATGAETSRYEGLLQQV